MIEIPTKGKVDCIKRGIEEGNPHLDLLIASYVDSFFDGFSAYKIDHKSLPNDRSFMDVVVKGIEDIVLLKDDFIAFLRVIIKSKQYCTPELFIDFFERLLQFYNDNGISLYTSSDIASYSVDNYRFFNQVLFISFVAQLIAAQRFDVLSGVLSARLIVTSSRRFESVESVNYIRFREYNYTLNEFVNDTYPNKHYSVTADFVKRFASPTIPFEELVKADILLYYLSVLYPGDSYLDRFWYPELAPYNHQVQVLPKLVSRRYFETSKCLFGVTSVEEYKKLLLDLTDSIHRLGTGIFGVPNIKEALLYETVATVA